MLRVAARALVLARVQPGALQSLALALCLLGPAPGCQDESSDGGALHGRVRDAVSGKPIAGALVTYTSDTLVISSDRTDKNGRYDLPVPEGNEQGRVRASKDGYEGPSESVFFDAESLEIDLVLRRL